MSRELAIKYIRQTQKDGFSDAEIRAELKGAGWQDSDIESAFAEVNAPAPEKPKPPEPAFIKPVENKSALPVQVPVKTEEVIKMPAQPQIKPIAQENLIENITIQKLQNSIPIVPVTTHPQTARKKLLIAASVFLFIFASATGAGYWYYSVNIYPKNVFRAALTSLAEAKSYRYDAEFKISFKKNPIEISGALNPFLPRVGSLFLRALTSPIDEGVFAVEENEAPNNFSIQIKGATDYSDANNPKQQMIMTLKTKEFLNRNVELENRFVDGMYYFQFTELPRIPDEFLRVGSVPPIDTASFEKKWVSFDPATIENTYDEYIKTLIADDPSFGEFLNDGQKVSQQQLSEEAVKRLEELWRKSTFVNWDQKQYDEFLGDTPMYRFKGTLNKEAYKSFVEELIKEADMDISQAELETFRKSLDSIGQVEFNIWIEKKTQQVVRITGSMEISDSESLSAGVVDLAFSIKLSDIDKPVSVEVPQDVTDFKIVLDSAFSIVLGGLDDARMKARDARRIADVKQIQLALELYYDKKGHYPSSLTVLAPEFIALIPKDPQTQKPYSYKYISGKKYRISAKLEDTKSQFLKNDAGPGDLYFDVAP